MDLKELAISREEKRNNSGKMILGSALLSSSLNPTADQFETMGKFYKLSGSPLMHLLNKEVSISSFLSFFFFLL